MLKIKNYGGGRKFKMAFSNIYLERTLMLQHIIIKQEVYRSKGTESNWFKEVASNQMFRLSRF